MKVKIQTPTKNYDIIIDSLKNLKFNRKIVVVTNPTIASLHKTYLKRFLQDQEVYFYEVPDGEEYKTLHTVENILNFCFEKKLNRKSLIIAFGGGVIGDMSGFAASIYQRGIDFLQIPTTLLSQVDASVGGKTGVNNKYGKNLIGAFWQPIGVFIDTYFLKTLPQREFSAGVAEIIKMAVCFDYNFFSFLEQANLFDENDLKLAIKRSVELKAMVVNQDERESGIRAKLNYGHTFAHVIEQETKYKQYLHGEAVGIGIVMANELAQKLDLLNKDEANRIKKLLQKYNIPTTYNIQDIDKFYEHFFLDKKATDTKIKFILPNHIGDSIIKDDIPKKLVVSSIEKFLNYMKS